MSEEEISVEQGRTDKLTYTVQRDWCDMMPISHGAARMHRILRSMMIESKDGTPKPTRKLTMDRLCWIMSSFQSKPVGEQTIRDYRNELLRHGMIEVIPGRLKTDPPRYVVHDLPPDGWSWWRHAWHADDAYTPEWRVNPPRPVTTDSENGHFVPRSAGVQVPKSGQSVADHNVVPHGVPGGCHGVPGGCHGVPGDAGHLTCAEGVPNKGLKEGSLRDPLLPPPTPPSSEPSGQPLRGPEEDEEEKATAPPAARPAAERHLDTDKVINDMRWPEGTDPRGDDLAKIRIGVSRALESGWTRERLTKHLIARMRWNKANDYVAVCLWLLARCPEDPSQGRSALEETIESLKAEIGARDAAVASCTGCDGNGWTEQGRHDHGRRGMDDELWELENPEQAAVNRSLNAKTSRVA